MVSLADITHRDPDILSGSLVFVGTRVQSALYSITSRAARVLMNF